MYAPGLEQFVSKLWQRWQIRGARPDALPMLDREGWVLTLCFRAKSSAWLILLLFGGLLTAVLVTQGVAPQKHRDFLIETIVFAVFSTVSAFYVLFVHWYRVELNEEGLELYRLCVPTRQMSWVDVVAFDYTPGDELLKLRDRNGKIISLYLSLNGLSSVRRCLAAFTPVSNIVSSWDKSDHALMQDVPSWRCDPMDLEDNPFDPLKISEGGSILENS
jgi:hypothetical protein